MQGLIFNLLGERLSESWGEDYWTDLVAATPGVDNPVFVGPKKYPDDAFQALIGQVCEDQGVARDRLLKDFGRWAFARLAAAHPVFLEGHADARSFLGTVEAVVHTEVRKLYDDAYLPRIVFEPTGDGALLAVYRSRRKLCWLAEGLIHGAGDHFAEPLTTVQDSCVHEGDSECLIRVKFERAGG